jgi:hypothetical protein
MVILGSLLVSGHVMMAAPVRVTIANLAPANGTYLTPVWVGFHNGSFDIFDFGSTASTALERLAEDGDPGPISASFLASGDGSEEATLPGPMGPIAPGQSASMIFSLNPLSANSRYMSYASMVIPSNDAFIANESAVAIQVFNAMGAFVGGSFVVIGSVVRDAGTEVNDEVPANTAFLGQMTPNTGVAEGGVVMQHPGFQPGGNILSNPMFANADFTAGGYQVALVSVEEVPEPSTMGLMAVALLFFALRRRCQV